MFSSQIVIRIDAQDKTLNLKDYGAYLRLFYSVTSYAVLLMLLWFFVLALITLITGCLLLFSFCPCIKEKAEFRSEYGRVIGLPLGVCRKSYLENEVTTWWIMFLFAVIELALGS